MNKLLRSLIVFGILIGNILNAQAQTTNPLIKHIQDLQATVQNRRSYLTDLRPDGNYMLPIGLLKAGDASSKPAILIDEIALYKDYAEMKAYVALLLPGSSNPVYFATVQPVRIGYNGGILGTARMELVEDRKVNVFGDDTYLKIKSGDGSGNSGSYIEFDCKGFSRASLDVEALLSSKLVKENADGTQNLGKTEADRVKARFRMEFADLNDIIASATIEPFQVRGMQRITFEINDAVFDMSDLSNASSVAFPAGYLEDYYTGVSPNLWRGFFLKSLSVKLPQEIEDRSANGRKQILVENLLIDNHGVSGTAAALDLIHLENGNLGGWSYSISRIALSFKANQLISGSMGGGIVLPIQKEATSLSYDAVIDRDLNFGFTVRTDETLEFDVFRATQVELETGSAINVTLIDKKFKASALLHGRMAIGASLTDDEPVPSKENGFHLGNIRFENFNISTTSPYIHSGIFSTSASATLGNFSVTFNTIKLAVTPENIGLRFDMWMSFANSEDAENGFSAGADLSILSKVDVLTGKHIYKYHKTQLNRVFLDINHGAFSLYGDLHFFRKDQVFGSGFKGALTVKMPMKITVSATALFGNVDGFKYWYTDAMANFENGLKVTPAVQITGFSGGLYYRVKQKPTGSVSAIAVVNSQTGLAYLPDPGAGIGIRAGVFFSLIGNPKAFNGNVGLEVSFNKGGGLNRAALRGFAAFMKEPAPDAATHANRAAAVLAGTEPGSVNDAVFAALSTGGGSLTANAIIEYVEDDPALSTSGFLNIEFISKLNVANGLLHGDFRGQAYFSSSTWHIFLGTPLVPNQVSIAGMLNAQAYFMVGKNLPPTREVPAHVQQSIGIYKGISRNTGSLGRGDGFAFGASLDANTGNLNFLIFYGSFSAGMGFDVALKNYGAVSCAGRDGLLGVNGWYANGSAYAYVAGEVGIRVKIFGKRKQLPILALKAGAMMQAKLPNPNWFQGAVGGSYRILGGLIKGKCRFQVTIGQQCEMVGAPEEQESNLRVISEIIPGNKEEEISVTSDIKVVFDVPMGVIHGEDVDGAAVTFYIDAPVFTIKVDGVDIPGSKSWNNEYTTLTFTPTQILPAHKTVDVVVEVTFEQQQGVIQVWDEETETFYERPNMVKYTENGVLHVDRMVSSFKTSDRPMRIMPENVLYSYPINNQQNYYQNESKNGYLVINQRQDYHFDPANNINPVGVLIQPDGSEIPVPLTLNQAERKYSYTFPDLANNSKYQFVIRSANTVVSANPDDEAEVDDKMIIYTLDFRTSKYSTLAEKLAAATKIHIPGRMGGLTLQTDENFEATEVGSSNSLIKAATDMSYVSKASTLNIFKDYPLIPLSGGYTIPAERFAAFLKGTFLSYDSANDYGKLSPGDGSSVSLVQVSSLTYDFSYIAGEYKSYYYRYAGTNPAMYATFVHPTEYWNRLEPNESYPNGYPYYGASGPRSHLNYWSYEGTADSYYDRNRTQFPGYLKPIYTDSNGNELSEPEHVWVSSLGQFQEYYSTKYFYSSEPTEEDKVSLSKILPFIDKKFEDSDLSTVQEDTYIVKYILPGTNITTSTNRVNK
ncbi:MAG: hypothetical protein H7Y13_16240 [Sphingobacteriaceae bacterium]|nr:hypothetical protein [Sphingobacteriaceae bacterium]